MPAKEGDKIPSVDLFEMTPTNKVNLNDISSNKKIIVFGLPGAFTPGCSKTHLPGFIEKAEELKKQGISEIFCISVNDPFVMDAWGKSMNVAGKVRMLADPCAEFAKAMDIAQDIPALGGTRCKRFSMIVDHGVIHNIQVEPDGTGLSCSLAQNLKLK